MPRPRGTGSIYQQKGSAVWWVKYYENGKAVRESSHETDLEKAETFLKRRLAQIMTGTFNGPKVERIRIAELADDFLRDYRVNRKRSIVNAEARWKRHLQPFFGHLRAIQVSTDLLTRYVDHRQQQGAANATVNRELAALKRMLYLGYRCTPPKVNRVPAFPLLSEDNIRTGFLEDGQFTKLTASYPELWFRTLLEMGRTYGWRKRELLKLRVSQVDLIARTIRLEPGTTKNRQGREVTMTDTIYSLLSQCVYAKAADAFVLTRPDGKPVRDFRKSWANVCCTAGLGRLTCPKCKATVTEHTERKRMRYRCEACAKSWKPKEVGYSGLIFHDLRRTAARNLRRAGVAEGVIQKIGGWKTRSVFERYAIVAQSDIADAMRKLEVQQNGHNQPDGHSFGHSDAPEPPKTTTQKTSVGQPN